MCWPTERIEAALAAGTHHRELLAYFGRTEYELLRELARGAASARGRAPGRSAGRAPRPTIYLLPGMLGSQLGWPRRGGQPPDLLWLDPSDVAHGRLSALRLDAPVRLRSLGVIPYTYLRLKLRLEACGFEVVVHDYDWRLSLDAVGATLARRLERDSAARLALVGHSMGGLLARAALKHCTAGTQRRIVKLIGVGTPFGGAIGAAQVLRASYPVLLRLAALDRLHPPEDLSATFRGFLSLYQMLPTAGVGALDLFTRSSWPRRGPGPSAAMLAAARRFLQALPAADERFVSIVGTGQRTVTGIERRGAQFRYEVSAAGDGTVPAAAAVCAGAAHYCLRCEHSQLPREARVATAIVELLERGSTAAVQAGVHTRKGRCAYVTDAQLRRQLGSKIEWHALGAASRRRYLNSLSAPPPSYRPVR
jgi:pimeloyl-ACP methyl ester carboxylesterase